jgi:hypothetical protein
MPVRTTASFGVRRSMVSQEMLSALRLAADRPLPLHQPASVGLAATNANAPKLAAASHEIRRMELLQVR